MRRTLRLLAASALLTALGTMSAYAGPAEDKFLASLTGTWTGSGMVKGADNGPVACTLVFKLTKAGQKFSGKCTVEDLGSQTFSGTLSYNDVKKQYEADSPSQTSTIGVKKGNSVIFTTKIRSLAGSGESVMVLTSKSIAIDFDVVRSKQAGHSKSHLVFKK